MSSVQPRNPEIIRNMFSNVAKNYDLANSVLSLGIHHLWRKTLVKQVGASENQRVLDCATGTGDLAIEFKKAVGTNGLVIGTDFCEEMLSFAPAKARKKNLIIKFEVADAMNLPYGDLEFDICSIAFGIRNVADPQKALNEMARVIKSGGRVAVLEFGQLQFPVISTAYSFYSEKVLPYVGGFITGQRSAYKYLQESSAQFPCGEKFLDLMKNTCQFSSVKQIPLSGGIAYIYIGIKK